jgi:hypothetical protein
MIGIAVASDADRDIAARIDRSGHGPSRDINADKLRPGVSNLRGTAPARFTMTDNLALNGR